MPPRKKRCSPHFAFARNRVRKEGFGFGPKEGRSTKYGETRLWNAISDNGLRIRSRSSRESNSGELAAGILVELEELTGQLGTEFARQLWSRSKP